MENNVTLEMIKTPVNFWKGVKIASYEVEDVKEDGTKQNKTKFPTFSYKNKSGQTVEPKYCSLHSNEVPEASAFVKWVKNLEGEELPKKSKISVAGKVFGVDKDSEFNKPRKDGSYTIATMGFALPDMDLRKANLRYYPEDGALKVECTQVKYTDNDGKWSLIRPWEVNDELNDILCEKAVEACMEEGIALPTD